MATAVHRPRKKASKVPVCDQPGMLHQKALELLEIELQKEDNALWVIAARAGVPFHWLVSLRRGATKQPSVNRIEHLIQYLTGRTVRI